MEVIRCDFIINKENSNKVKFKIITLFPEKIQKVKIESANVSCESVDGYRVRYKLIVGNCTSPISEAKNLTDFTKSEMEEIVKRAGISMASVYREETTEAVYVD